MNEPKGPPVQTDPEFHLWRILDHTRFMIARVREKELAQFGLTAEQSHVLDILIAQGGMATINWIVKITQRQHHSISTLVTRMSRQGLVTKKKNPNDLRKWDVIVTPRGEQVFRDLTRDSIHHILSCLDGQGQNRLKYHLLCLLKQAYEALDQEEPPLYRGERERLAARE
jgi:DNA-binding MarR family transcriptional regulator